jgi:hypothetical protein
MPAARTPRLIRIVLFGAGLFGAAAFAQTQRPSVDSRGNVSMPAFAVPYSAYASPEAQRQFQQMLEQGRHAPGIGSIAARQRHRVLINQHGGAFLEVSARSLPRGTGPGILCGIDSHAPCHEPTDRPGH